MKFITTALNASGTLRELAQSLSRMFTHLQERLDVDSVRVGDTTKLDHDGTVTVGAFTMAEGAAADKVLTSDADGVASWGTAAASVAGSDTEVQYNDGGSLGAEAAFAYNDTSNTLIVQNITTADITATGEVQCEHLRSTDDAVISDDCSVGGDLTVTGELKGARGTFDAGHNGTAITATAYLLWNGITMGAAKGWVMPRAGSIVTVAGQFQVVSSTGGTAKLDIYDGANIVASTGSVTCDDEVGNYVEKQAEAVRGLVTFTVKKVLSAKLTITGTCQIACPSIVMDVQYDT